MKRGFSALILIVVLLVGVAWLSAGGRADPAAGERQTLSAALGPAPRARNLKIDYALVDRRIAALMQRDDMVGLAVAIVENGRPTFVKGYGRVSAESDERVTPHTVFRWASVSKGVASSLVARLVVSGRLDFVHSAAYYGSSLKLDRHGEEQATLIDILSHRLGLPKNAYDGRLEGGIEPAVIRASLGDIPALCPPGSCHSYQNSAYDSVSEIVANATGRSYADEVRARLFAPLGMTSASIGRAGLIGAKSWARPHRGQKPIEVVDAYYRIPAAAGVNSNIADMARWMVAQMGGAPDVLSPAMLNVIHEARVATPRPFGSNGFGRALSNAGYGLGWRSFDFRGHRLVGHGGAVSGYRSEIVFDPKAKAGVVLMWNSNAGRPFRLPGEIMDSFYGEAFTDMLELDDDKPNAADRPVPRSET